MNSMERLKMPKVSVIITCYNLGQYLDEAVDSVLAQTYQDFEVIIVNDGSTDEFTNNLLAHYARPKTKVLSTDNQGLPSARNNGIKISSGEYICCLDADDKYHSEFLEKTVGVLDGDTNHKLGFVTTWVQDFGEKNDEWTTLEYDPWREAVANGIHGASIFRRECWAKKGGYSANLSGYPDWDLWLSIIGMGYKWVSIKEPLFYYRIRPGSMVKGSDEKRLDLYRQIVRNNKEFYQNNFEEILVKFMEMLISEQKSRAQINDNYLQMSANYEKVVQDYKALEQELSETEAELASIHQSFIWLLATKARRVINTLLPSKFKK
jgi:glycosyltransferase involved in cell wall biosynthesis